VSSTKAGDAHQFLILLDPGFSLPSDFLGRYLHLDFPQGGARSFCRAHIFECKEVGGEASNGEVRGAIQAPSSLKS
jgi:hypothetical protein